MLISRAGIAALLLGLALPLAAPAQYPNAIVNDPWTLDPQEVTIAINPTNPDNLAAGANPVYTYFSFDGGQSWTEHMLFTPLGAFGDPSVIFDAFGDLYYGHLSWADDGAGGWLDRIVVQKSTDGGVSWDDGVGIGYNPPKDQDKEWLASDHTGSAYHGNLYVAWTEFDTMDSTDPADSTRILFARSTDHGASWSAPLRISDRGGNCADSDDTVEGAVPAVGPAGQVYVSWAGHEQLYFDRSLDGGLSFGSDRIVAAQPGGWDFTVPGIYRSNGFPVTACDVSGSPYRGRVYIAWSDQREGPTDTNVYLIASADEGESWGPIVRVNTDNSGRHQFFPWLAVDPATGYLYLVFYDRRSTTGDATDVYLARSTDGGATFVNTKVSDSSFVPWEWIFFGDYTNIAALDGKVHPIWMRMDDGDLSIWTAAIDAPADDVLPDYPFRLAQNFPNPFNPPTRIDFSLDAPARVELSIFEPRGVPVRTLIRGIVLGGDREVYWDGRDGEGRPMSAGVYLYRLTVGAQSLTRKMVLVK